jgi:hypothetical protein
MSDSRAKKRAHGRVFEACPNCIYCGGEVPAVSIDHVPPRAMFRGRRRPKGLEFASCKGCNEGTSRIISLRRSSRAFSDALTAAAASHMTLRTMAVASR